jgi:hypothetical protein
MRPLRRNSHRFLAALRIEAVPCRFLRALATAGAKRFGARYSRDISVGSAITAFPTASTGD